MNKSGPNREAFIEDLLANNYTTYFVATHPKYAKGNRAFRFTASPISPAVPYHWRYSETRRRLMELSGLLTTEEAERRNINFVNPALRDFMPAATLSTLRGGNQMLLPGEKAYTHRHSANAFRMVLEAPPKGAYTVVEGTRIPMHPGDMILTPNWTWHDHHNEGESHAIWYDGLDVLMAYWIGAVFYEEYKDVSSDAYYPTKRDVDALDNTYGPGLVNRDAGLPEHIPSSDNTLLYYPYSKTRKLLQGLSDAGSGNSRDGVLFEYVNPLTAGPAFPSMSASVRLVRGKTSLEAWNRVENVIFIVLEGSVTFTLPGGVKFMTEPRDVVAMPSWVPYTISNTEREPSVLVSQSDRPVVEKLGLYRELRAE